jgi:hypothetical protein
LIQFHCRRQNSETVLVYSDAASFLEQGKLGVGVGARNHIAVSACSEPISAVFALEFTAALEFAVFALEFAAALSPSEPIDTETFSLEWILHFAPLFSLHFYYLSFCGLLICGGHVANNRHFKTRVY